MGPSLGLQICPAVCIWHFNILWGRLLVEDVSTTLKQCGAGCLEKTVPNKCAKQNAHPLQSQRLVANTPNLQNDNLLSAMTSERHIASPHHSFSDATPATLKEGPCISVSAQGSHRVLLQPSELGHSEITECTASAFSKLPYPQARALVKGRRLERKQSE